MTDKTEPKGSTSSSLDEHPGGITSDLPNRCDSCGHHRREHALADGTCGCALCVGFIEPKAPAGSSRGDFCGWCKHHRRYHGPELCAACSGFTADNHHAFAPAEPETAGECEGGCVIYTEPPCSPKGGCICGGEWWTHGCKHSPRPPDAETGGEPECEHPDGCPDRGLCGKTCGFADQLKGIRVMPRPKPEAPESPCPEGGDCRRSLQCPDGCRRLIPEGPVSIPPRPPYALTYVTGSGARTRLALPGEASVAVADGVLVISHASGVLGIAEVMPWKEGA